MKATKHINNIYLVCWTSCPNPPFWLRSHLSINTNNKGLFKCTCTLKKEKRKKLLRQWHSTSQKTQISSNTVKFVCDWYRKCVCYSVPSNNFDWSKKIDSWALLLDFFVSITDFRLFKGRIRLSDSIRLARPLSRCRCRRDRLVQKCE